MKKNYVCYIAIALICAMIMGCGASGETHISVPESTAAETDASTGVGNVVSDEASTAATDETVPGETEEDIVYEGDAATYYIDVAYHEQIGRYHAALTEKWDEGKYFENELSSLPFYYYEGNPLENVGFGFADLDNDGRWELIIGAILNAERDPAVFEIWTLVDGEPVLLLQGGTRNRYVLQYVEEDQMWYIVNEGSNGAASHVTYYLMLSEGKLVVVQGVMFDAFADEENPWFLTYDLDGDVSNDVPIDEETANAILDTNRKYYTALEYFPYIYFN